LNINNDQLNYHDFIDVNSVMRKLWNICTTFVVFLMSLTSKDRIHVTQALATDNPPHLDLAIRGDTKTLERIRNSPIDQPSPLESSVTTGILYLWHDHWKAAHEIAQSQEGEADHDLLHAIVHRREGDFSNAQYWFRNAGPHGCYPLIASRLSKNLDGHSLLGTLLANRTWNPIAFVQAIQKRTTVNDRILREIQAVELMTFYEWMRNKA
jgi:hypothetical protein